MIDFNTSSGSYMGMEVPDHTRESIENYLVRGWSPGGFVTAMLAMDMQRALCNADTANRQMMWAIGRWIIESCPEQAWGSYEKVQNWVANVDEVRTQYADRVEKRHVWQTLQSAT